MVHVVRSNLSPIGPATTAFLECDACGGVLDDPQDTSAEDLLADRIRLRIRARGRRWRSITILVPREDLGELVSHRVDLCPDCRRPRRGPREYKTAPPGPWSPN